MIKDLPHSAVTVVIRTDGNFLEKNRSRSTAERCSNPVDREELDTDIDVEASLKNSGIWVSGVLSYDGLLLVPDQGRSAERWLNILL